MADMRDPYDVLGVARDADQNTIKKAFGPKSVALLNFMLVFPVKQGYRYMFLPLRKNFPLRNFKIASRPLLAVARAHRENLGSGFSLCPLCALVSVANGREKDFF